MPWLKVTLTWLMPPSVVGEIALEPHADAAQPVHACGSFGVRFQKL